MTFVFSSYYSLQAQFGSEWRGYLASKDGQRDDRVFITDGVIWYANEQGVEKHDIVTGQQELSANFRLTYIHQAPDDEIWGLGPDNDIYTYTSSKWQSFSVPDSVRNYAPPIGSIFNGFASMVVDSSNTLWIAALYCVWKYDGLTWARFDITDIGVGNFIYDIEVDRKGAIWVSLNDNRSEIASYQNNAWTVYNINTHGLPTGQRIGNTHVDDRNRKWWALSCDAPTFSCSDGNLFLMYNDTTWTTFTQTDVGVAVEDVQHIDGIGTSFWATTTSPLSLLYYDGATWTSYDPKIYEMANPSTSVTNNFVVDDNNQFWGYNYLRLFSFNGATTTSYNVGTSGNYLRGTHQLKAVGGSKLLWLNGEVGYANLDNNTIDVIDELAFENDTSNYFLLDRNYYADLEYLAPNDIWVVQTGSYESLNTGFGTDTLSLFHYDGSTWTETKIDTQVAPNTTRVTDMAVNNNSVWLATTSEGLLNWNGSAWTGNYPTPLNGDLENISITNTGTLWLSNNNQLFEYDGTTVNTYDHTTTALPDADITALRYDNTTSTLWATTDSAGLIEYTNGTWTTYNTQNSGIATDHLLALALTSTGEVWLGSRDSGLVHYDGTTTWKVINTNTPNSPMVDNEVATLEVDNNGNVWFFNDQLLLVYQEGGLVNLQQLPDATSASSLKSYPNPFSHNTTIEYHLEQSATTSLMIYDAQGRVVAILLQNQAQDKGVQQVEWQPNARLVSGLYFYSVVSKGAIIGAGKLFYRAER